jgi:hypothetical protein
VYLGESGTLPVNADTYNNQPSLDKEIWEAHAGKYKDKIKDIPLSLKHIYE